VRVEDEDRLVPSDDTDSDRPDASLGHVDGRTGRWGGPPSDLDHVVWQVVEAEPTDLAGLLAGSRFALHSPTPEDHDHDLLGPAVIHAGQRLRHDIDSCLLEALASRCLPWGLARLDQSARHLPDVDFVSANEQETPVFDDGGDRAQKHLPFLNELHEHATHGSRMDERDQRVS
jgi:hypothetical protein